LPGTNEVRIEAGVYHEHVWLASCCTGRVVVTRGWNPALTSRGRASATTVDGDGTGRPLRGAVNRGELSIAGLTLRNGYADGTTGPPRGGALVVPTFGAARLELTPLEGRGSRAQSPTPDVFAQGGGAFLSVYDASQVSLRDTLFRQNGADEADGTPVSAEGGGLFVSVLHKARAEVTRNRFSGNVARGTNAARGAGLPCRTSTSGLAASVNENTFEGNRVLYLGPDDDYRKK